MLFVVRLTDKPDSLPLRERLMAQHLDWLDRHRETVLVAGSVRVEVDAAPVGGCWIVDAPSKADVQELLKTDPFWAQGLRSAVEILHWSKAFPDRRAVV